MRKLIKSLPQMHWDGSDMGGFSVDQPGAPTDFTVLLGEWVGSDRTSFNAQTLGMFVQREDCTPPNGALDGLILTIAQHRMRLIGCHGTDPWRVWFIAERIKD
jgi:hypothetical protein